MPHVEMSNYSNNTCIVGKLFLNNETIKNEPNTSAATATSNELNSIILDQAAALLRAGEVVAFPTETVYGLGANALNETAVKRIFTAKGRPQDNPLIVHISSINMLSQLLKGGEGGGLSDGEDYLNIIPPQYRALIERFWPGPLTLLFTRPPHVPAIVTAGQPTIAIRFPAHPVARALIERCGFPIAAPSANVSGRPSPTLAQHVYADLSTKIPMIVDGGACSSGVESTVLDAVTSIGSGRCQSSSSSSSTTTTTSSTWPTPVILRPGGVTVEMIQSVPGFEGVAVYKRDFVDAALEAAPSTPGMKYRHYTPEAEVVLFEPAGPCTSTSSSSSTTNTTTTTLPSLMREVVSSEISRLYLIHHHRHQQQQNDQPLQLLKIGIMRSQSLEPYNTPSPPSSSLLAIEDFYLGSIPEQVAHNLYSGLRDLEARGVNVILVEGVGEDREGYAVMNRLKKAASRTIRLKL